MESRPSWHAAQGKREGGRILVKFKGSRYLIASTCYSSVDEGKVRLRVLLRGV